MMDELKDVKRVLNPTEVLLVVDAMTGQEAAGTIICITHAMPISLPCAKYYSLPFYACLYALPLLLKNEVNHVTQVKRSILTRQFQLCSSFASCPINCQIMDFSQ